MQEIYHDGHKGPEIPVDDEHLLEQIKASLAKPNVREVRIRSPRDYSRATHARENERRLRQIKKKMLEVTGYQPIDGELDLENPPDEWTAIVDQPKEAS